MSVLDKIKEPVREELNEFEKTFPQLIKSEIPLLNIVVNYILRRKGKQMRPILVFLSAKLTGTITPSTYVAASLIEMLHTATLIHDDVVDESYERRGHFSINALWKTKMSVLIGDYLLSQGLLLSINRNEVDLLRIVSNGVREMIEGELLQIQHSRKLAITEKQYFEIIRKKTATLISACAACGAKSVRAPENTVELMKLFGENMGIAFQIKDDLLDYQVNTSIGKPLGNDLREKKITLPLIIALNNTGSQDKRRILSLINKGKASSEEFHEVIRFIDQQGGFKYSLHKMNEYRDNGIKILDSFTDSSSKRSLIEFSYYTTERNK